MHKISIAAAAIAAVACSGAFCNCAQAMMPLPPSAFSPAEAGTTPIVPIAVICGRTGCAPVWTKRVRKPPPNFVKRAVPLTITVNQHQNAAPLR
jgi:hypothetical protein